MVAQACNPDTKEAEARGSGVQSHSQLHGKFKASLGYIRSCGFCLFVCFLNFLIIRLNQKLESFLL